MGEEVRPRILQQARLRYAAPFKFEVRVRDQAGNYELTREVEFLGPEAQLLREEEAEQRAKGESVREVVNLFECNGSTTHSRKVCRTQSLGVVHEFVEHEQLAQIFDLRLVQLRDCFEKASSET